MNCPVCDATLRTVTKHNVEVDICPDCKGVWLNRGELDKIVEMASAGGPSGYGEEPRDERPVARQEYRPERRDEGDYRERDDRSEPDRRHGKQKRRGSWLGEIFEGFGGDDD